MYWVQEFLLSVIGVNKVKYSASWNKNRDKKQTRELSMKIRCQIKKEIKTSDYETNATKSDQNDFCGVG
jgi:hypothetical protein